MAFEKLIELENGSMALYWRVLQVMDSRKDGTLSFELAGYKTAQHRLDGKPPVLTETFFLSDEEYPQAALDSGGALGVVYNVLKTTPKFIGAIDV